MFILITKTLVNNFIIAFPLIKKWFCFKESNIYIFFYTLDRLKVKWKVIVEQAALYAKSKTFYLFFTDENSLTSMIKSLFFNSYNKD